MKKTYISPTMGSINMNISSVLMGSLYSTSETEAGAGTSSETVNLGRENNNFWSETE